MVVLGGFTILTRIVSLIVGDFLAHQVGRLDEIVAQVAVAGFGKAAILSREITGAGTRPPEASDFGDSVL